MGYDVTFQLIDQRAVRAMFACLKEGKPPPPSPFDQRDDASSIWAEAREKIFGDDLELAALTAGQLAAIWSAASLSYVWTRNFAVTYHPLRMEDELQAVPTTGWSSPSWLFVGLRDELEWSGRLEGNYTVGGYAYMVEDAARATKRFLDGLAPEMRRRVLPLLKILRAAQRLKLSVLESTDLLGVEGPNPETLNWPGLDRFGLEGGPLTAEEWRRFRAARPSFGDIEDAVDRIVQCDLRDDEARTEVYALLRETDLAAGYADPFLPRIEAWLESAMEAGEHAVEDSGFDALWNAIQDFADFEKRPTALGLTRAIEKEAPNADEARGQLLHRAFLWVVNSYYDTELTQDEVEQTSRAWLALFDHLPQLAFPFTETLIESSTLITHVATKLLERDPSALVLRGVAAVLRSQWGWEDAEASWIEAFFEEHRDAIVALILYGFDDGSAEARKAATELMRPWAFRDARLAPLIAVSLERGNVHELSRIASSVAVQAETADELERLCLALWEKQSEEAVLTVELLKAGRDIVVDALRRYVTAYEGHESKGSRIASGTTWLTTELLRAGFHQHALDAIALVIDEVAEADRSGLYYDRARAHAELGALDDAARALSRAIELSSYNANKAMKENSFAALRDLPEHATLFS